MGGSASNQGRVTLVLGLMAGLLAVGLAVVPQAAADEAAASLQHADDPVRVIVDLAVPARPEGELAPDERGAQRAEIARARAAVLRELGEEHARVLHAYRTVPQLALEATAEGLEVLADSPHVEHVHPDEPAWPQVSTTGELVEATRLHEVGVLGSAHTIAVLDSGVDREHPFLRGRIVAEACYSNTGGAAWRSSLCPNGASVQLGPGAGEACTVPDSDCWHGTHVAGIAAGAAIFETDSPMPDDGVAPGARIMPVQVFHRLDSGCPRGMSTPCVSSHMSDIVAGMERVYALRDRHRIAAVNISLAGNGKHTAPCPNHETAAMIANLRSVGIPTVVASGNFAWHDGVAAPACVPDAIAVGSTTRSDEVSWFSNGHPTLVDVLAPGSSITSSLPGGAFGSRSGTSMAAPHVAGAWALLRTHDPDASFADLLWALRSTGKPVTDDRGPTRYTLPRIRLQQAAVAGLGPATGCYPRPFTDVGPAHPFCDDIAWLVGARITGGYADGTFRPTGTVSRQAMATFLHRLAGSEPAAADAPEFTDVPEDHPFRTAIAWMADEGITGGYADGTFRPTEPVSRQAMAAFLHRFADRPAASLEVLEGLADVDESHAFAAEIAWLVESGVSTGYTDGTYRPRIDVARQAMAAFLHRFDER